MQLIKTLQSLCFILSSEMFSIFHVLWGDYKVGAQLFTRAGTDLTCRSILTVWTMKAKPRWTVKPGYISGSICERCITLGGGCNPCPGQGRLAQSSRSCRVLTFVGLTRMWPKTSAQVCCHMLSPIFSKQPWAPTNLIPAPSETFQ